MELNIAQITRIKSVINVFETGSIEGKYHAISIYKDGPAINGTKCLQITYGRSQTTEFGNLAKLIEMYVNAKGVYAETLRPYLGRIGKQPSLQNDQVFKQTLIMAGKNDPIMKTTQDDFFDSIYFRPALQWAEENGFTLPLSMLVIYDSKVHSGGILPFLRKRFPEKTPINGGKEQAWIKAYVETRNSWLATHSMKILQATTYRTQCFLKLMENGNWNLDQSFQAHGVLIP